jgi:hypothetical protein
VCLSVAPPLREWFSKGRLPWEPWQTTLSFKASVKHVVYSLVLVLVASCNRLSKLASCSCFGLVRWCTVVGCWLCRAGCICVDSGVSSMLPSARLLFRCLMVPVRPGAAANRCLALAWLLIMVYWEKCCPACCSACHHGTSGTCDAPRVAHNSNRSVTRPSPHWHVTRRVVGPPPLEVCLLNCDSFSNKAVHRLYCCCVGEYAVVLRNGLRYVELLSSCLFVALAHLLCLSLCL